jgi:hypothetical protein
MQEFIVLLSSMIFTQGRIKDNSGGVVDGH